MKRRVWAMILLAALCAAPALGEEDVTALTYAVFAYLPDPARYQDLIERRWAGVEPDIRLIRAEWDCYTDGAPDGVDVVIFDAVARDRLVASGWIQPISPDAVLGGQDIFPFALDGLTVDGRLYGIPVFLCGNFLVYDMDSEAVAGAERLTDLADKPGILVVNSENPWNRPQYVIEALADAQGTADPAPDSEADEVMALIDSLAMAEHKRDEDDQVALAYDGGAGMGYIGFSESMRLLHRRIGSTGIKSVSFSDRPDVRRLYVDAVAVVSGVGVARYEKCLELMNVMADADLLSELSVQDGAPQYLLLARRSPYHALSEAFPLYGRLGELAGYADNHVILTS